MQYDSSTTSKETEGPDLSVDNLAPFGTAKSLISCAPPAWKVLCCQTGVSLCSQSLGRKNDRVHCLLGPYWPMLFLTYSIAFFPGYIFCRYLYSSSSTEWALIVILLWLCTLISLSITAFRDPGIVRRSSSLTVENAERRSVQATKSAAQEDDQQRLDTEAHPPSKEEENLSEAMQLQNSTVLEDIQAEHNRLFGRKPHVGHRDAGVRRFRYCTMCDMEKPPNAEHCDFLGRCIYDYDHFCPWVNNAVGRNNSVWFFTFLFSLAAFLLVAFTGGILSIGHATTKLKHHKAFRGYTKAG